MIVSGVLSLSKVERVQSMLNVPGHFLFPVFKSKHYFCHAYVCRAAARTHTNTHFFFFRLSQPLAHFAPAASEPNQPKYDKFRQNREIYQVRFLGVHADFCVFINAAISDIQVSS